MGHAAKLYKRLDALEASLAEQLGHSLAECAAGRCDLLFCAREFLPEGYPLTLRTGLADGFLTQAKEIRALRKKVGEPFEGSLAWRYRESCRNWADTRDPHRGSARTIARRLLAEAGI